MLTLSCICIRERKVNVHPWSWNLQQQHSSPRCHRTKNPLNHSSWNEHNHVRFFIIKSEQSLPNTTSYWMQWEALQVVRSFNKLICVSADTPGFCYKRGPGSQGLGPKAKVPTKLLVSVTVLQPKKSALGVSLFCLARDLNLACQSSPQSPRALVTHPVRFAKSLDQLNENYLEAPMW